MQKKVIKKYEIHRLYLLQNDKQRVHRTFYKEGYPTYVTWCNYNLMSLKGMSIKNTLIVEINIKSNLNALNLGIKWPESVSLKNMLY